MVAPEQPESADTPTYFRVCSICRTPIPFSARYYRCSVSTCNRARLALYFCSVACWDAHLPEARHRDAWAEEARAPTLQEFQAEQQQEQAAETSPETPMDQKPPRERKIVATGSDAELPREVLVVVSKLKAYIRARSGMNTSDSVTEAISDHLRRICDRAIENANSENRKTVLDRDFKALFKVGQ